MARARTASLGPASRPVAIPDGVDDPTKRYGLDRVLDLAAEKDRGFDAGVFAEMLTRIDRRPRAAFPLDDPQFVTLQTAVSSGGSGPFTAPARRSEAGASVAIAVPTSRSADRRPAHGPGRR